MNIQCIYICMYVCIYIYIYIYYSKVVGVNIYILYLSVEYIYIIMYTDGQTYFDLLSRDFFFSLSLSLSFLTLCSFVVIIIYIYIL